MAMEENRPSWFTRHLNRSSWPLQIVKTQEISDIEGLRKLQAKRVKRRRGESETELLLEKLK